MDSCIKHPHELGVGHCGRCGGSWCADCLVHPFGPSKPPFCLSCAMFTAGVRSHAERPALGRKELKVLAKQAKAEARSGRRAPSIEAPSLPELPPVAPATEPDTDWSSSWWEDREPTLSD